MRIALNGSSLGACSLDEELDAAAAAGFSLVELRAPKLEDVTDLSRRLSSRRLQAWTINSLEGPAKGTCARRLGGRQHGRPPAGRLT